MRANIRSQAFASQSSAIPGAILADALYRLDEAAARMGWGAHALRAARRRGLKVHRCGKRIYISGRDLVCFVTNAGGHDDN